MSRPNAAYAIAIDHELFETERPAIPVGLSVYVGDIQTAIMESNEAVVKLMAARNHSHLTAMRDACVEVERMAQKANVLAAVLERKIAELQNKDTRVRT
jgi:hypothetical protein